MLFRSPVVSDSLWPHGLQHARSPVLHCLPELAQTHVHWVSDAIQPSHSLPPLSPPSFNFFPASGSFPVSQLFASGGQSISASAPVHPMHIQNWFPLGMIGLISFLSKGLSWVFFSTTVRKPQFFSAQPSLWSDSHIYAWLLGTCVSKVISAF